jgi:transcriptional regulator with XRE-family HTH domain
MRRFGKWLRETRIKRGMTQAHLAQSSGVTGSYISHLEHGDFPTREGSPSRPAVAIVDAIADALGVSREEARLAATYASPDQVPQITFGQWLRKARRTRGMSQITLAKNIGVTGSFISLLEIGALTKQGLPIRPALHSVDAIARTLGTSCEEARLAAGYAPRNEDIDSGALTES